MGRTLRDQRINQFLYYSIGGVIVAIILFIIIFNTFNAYLKILHFNPSIKMFYNLLTIVTLFS